MSGTVESDCKIPCKKTTSTIVSGPSNLQDRDTSAVFITLTHHVPVTAVTVDTLDIMTLLNFLGSNLGLWPGMGLFQMLEGAIGLIAVYNVMEKLK